MDHMPCSVPFDTCQFGVGKAREARPVLVGADPAAALAWPSGAVQGRHGGLPLRSIGDLAYMDASVIANS